MPKQSINLLARPLERSIKSAKYDVRSAPPGESIGLPPGKRVITNSCAGEARAEQDNKDWPILITLCAY
jgi:hypothetical protein